MEAIIYVRVSSEQQVDGTSIETQEQRCRDAAARYGLNVLGVRADKGISGKSTAGRAALADAVALCKEYKAALIVYKFDRLARNTMDAQVLRESLLSAGCRVISATEGEAEASPISKMMFTMMSAFAELDNDMRAERCRGGMVARAKEGCWVTHTPTGYRRVKVGRRPLLEPDPEKAPFIEAAFRGIADGSLTPIEAEKTIEKGCGVCRALAWRILRQPVYGGIIQSVLTDGRKVKAAFPSIVPESTFYAVQRILDRLERKDKVHNMNNPDFPYANVLLCPVCGAPVRGGNVSNGHGARYGYYFCSKPGHMSVRAEVVVKSVAERLASLGENADFFEALKRHVAEQADEIVKRREKVRAERAAALSSAEAKMVKLRELYLNEDFSREDYEKVRGPLERQIEDLRADLMDMEQSVELHESLINGMIELFKHTEGLINGLPPEDAKNLCRFMFGKAVLTKNGIEPSKDSLYQRIKASDWDAFENGGGEWI